MKVCPYCAGDIQDEAVVCRYCHSDLPPFRASAGRRRCPYCAEFIASSLTTCNHCQREISLDPGAGFFEPTSEPEFEPTHSEAADAEPLMAALPATPAPPPPSQPTSLKDILGSMDARKGSAYADDSPPERDEAFEAEPAFGSEAEWRSHKTPPFSLSPTEEASFALGEWDKDEEGSLGSEPDTWEEPNAPDLDSGSWHPEELGTPADESDRFIEDRPPTSSRDSGVFHRTLRPRTGSDSGEWRRSQEVDRSRDSGAWGRKEDSGVRESETWRQHYTPPPSPPGGRSLNYSSQASLRRSAIAERLAELDSTTRKERASAKPAAEPAGLHPGPFLIVAVAMLSVALIYFLGPGRNALAFLLAPPTATQASAPVAQSTPTSLPTALHPLIKDTSAPTVTPASSPGNCLTWDQVSADDVGKELCVQGTVKRWFATQDFPMVVIFSEEPATFIFVDATEAPSFVKPGTCISGTGLVEIMGGERPYIEFSEPPTVCDQPE